jgi:hypothetical protein
VQIKQQKQQDMDDDDADGDDDSLVHDNLPRSYGWVQFKQAIELLQYGGLTAVGNTYIDSIQFRRVYIIIAYVSAVINRSLFTRPYRRCSAKKFSFRLTSDDPMQQRFHSSEDRLSRPDPCTKHESLSILMIGSLVLILCNACSSSEIQIILISSGID